MRSQDKTFLRKVNTIGIVESRDFWGIEDNFRVSFGKYKTKERALEVLDEIQEAQLGNFYYRCPSNVKVSSKEDRIVYEMPEK